MWALLRYAEVLSWSNGPWYEREPPTLPPRRELQISGSGFYSVAQLRCPSLSPDFGVSERFGPVCTCLVHCFAPMACF